MAVQQYGVLHTETKQKISEAAEILLEAHFGLIDPKGAIFSRVSQGEFLVRIEDAWFRVVVSTRTS